MNSKTCSCEIMDELLSMARKLYILIFGDPGLNTSLPSRYNIPFTIYHSEKIYWTPWIAKHYINPLNPGAFCEKGVSWTFWWFLGWILAKLALIWSKMHLHHDSLALLPLASCFGTFCLGHAQKSNFEIVFGRESDLRL